ncbi:SDR family oxidoreductase [Patescibacteria group bacterium]
MKCIVTGGAGFIGSHLVDRLITEGNEVKVIDNLSTGKKENLNLKADFYHLDICDPSFWHEKDRVESLFKNTDFVFHLAAVPSVLVSVEDPLGTSENNILGTLNVFKAASDARVKRIVFASSSAIYGNQDVLPIKENMKPAPISPYALQKLVGEQFAKLFVQLYQIPIVSLRYFNVYGPRVDPDSEYSLVIGKFLKQKNQGKPLTIFGDGKQTRGFCYVDDVVEANIKAMKSEKIKGGETINISTKESHSVNYLADLIGGKVQYLPKRPGDVLHTEADIGLAENFLGWQPKVSFAEGLKKTAQWYENQKEQK